MWAGFLRPLVPVVYDYVITGLITGRNMYYRPVLAFTIPESSSPLIDCKPFRLKVLSFARSFTTLSNSSLVRGCDLLYIFASFIAYQTKNGLSKNDFMFGAIHKVMHEYSQSFLVNGTRKSVLHCSTARDNCRI